MAQCTQDWLFAWTCLHHNLRESASLGVLPSAQYLLKMVDKQRGIMAVLLITTLLGENDMARG